MLLFTFTVIIKNIKCIFYEKSREMLLCKTPKFLEKLVEIFRPFL